MDPIMIVAIIAVAIVGIALGFIVNRSMTASSNRQAAGEAATLVEDARKQAETMRREAEIEAKDQALRYRQELEEEKKERMREVRTAESRVAQREETLAQREESLDRRVESLDAREHQLSSLQGQVERRERDVNEAESAIVRHREEAQIEINQALERAAGMSPEEAKAELLETIHDEVTRESAVIIRDAETRTKAEADKKAREILSLAIQRVAADHSAESTVSTIHIPSDDLKGRIIGREGRNIRSFEQLTGTNLIIDDTPECVTISCFDPVRREIGRVTMENLIADGRIHPARIEEMYEKAVRLVNQRVQEAGEQATFDAGIHDLHPELVNTLGRLRYRTSFGQNVLNHSLEVAYLASVMASELGLDPIPVKRAGLLHDLGKAVDHEVEGSHAVIGADLARRFGERPEIVHAIEAHHNDIEPNSTMDVLIQAADAVSAARPGARKETLDAYIKRLEKLEEIANAHAGVERTYAIQAGREVRVMVEPEVVDEAASVVLAHDIAQQIENEMQYPGQVKVVVIRESRAVDYAK
ncbi:ribonuclease Y [Adlercreutzia muris]|uniref:ribonuclease Y n=1 Tax=Adlercreutzia muris TaxID=1796610 RepID=UPI0010941C99|nr:ribonuclease Y [Adlercreutzia muris]MCU7585059.1 ribonuclease Y [Adlercreutzia muris]TGY75158.1 ribonuclease Y [Enterorhabdus sp. NM05_H27]